ncbi:glycosyltransferase family 2 protein [Azohydromonas sediminis]|uniref:glycosyltransferase family 2 protein n=1 Tax=Azohydromonas sediminis TaxID=2259674 RepID=UPI000E6586A0|nr:glycosyltransferase family 2 protein [Azohydromonas sediminis]
MHEPITALILTFNEEKHIDRCLRSLSGVVSQVVVIDSGSTDRTVEICREHGVEVYTNPWKNYSSQFNWGLDHCDIRGAWCLRIDADEYLSEPLRGALRDRVAAGLVPDAVTGLYVHRVMVFMGRAIRWGGCGGLYMLRLFRTGRGRCEERWMDEHIVLDGGATGRLPGELIDQNLNNIGWWVAKHNGYATREAIDLLNLKYRFDTCSAHNAIGGHSQAARKRWFKERVYAHLWPGLRASLYFLFRYFGLLGFLDGYPGFVFHFMQGFWYRFLVDLKVGELERRAKRTGVPIEEVVMIEYGIRLCRSTDSPCR